MKTKTTNYRKPITNGDLLFWGNAPRTDHLFVVTGMPTKANRKVTVPIKLDEEAAVFTPEAGRYCQGTTIDDVREGVKGKWLLSGGTLVANSRKQIAVGLRDGNAPDPFVWTNIAAGRCDQKLEDHCQEEFETEFLCCVKKGKIWHQVSFGKHTRLLCELDSPTVRRKLTEVVASIYQSGRMLNHHSAVTLTYDRPLATPLTQTIEVQWITNSGAPIIEKLKGYVYMDVKNHTLEFRRAVTLRLKDKAITDIVLFFGEGTGHAEWKSFADLKSLATAQKTGPRLVSPFLDALVK